MTFTLFSLHSIARSVTLGAACIFLTTAALAQTGETPPMPEVLKNLAAEGTQMRYLGREHGLDGWLAIKGGQEQYFYVTADRQAILSGVLFDKNGKMVTLDQIAALQKDEDAAIDFFATSRLDAPDDAKTTKTQKAFKTPAEQLFSNIEASNWIPLGDKNAPIIYTFIDPQCPHCHAFIQKVRHDYIETGKLQMRIIPVGGRPDTKSQAAFLLAIPDPQERWWAHVDGDKDALPISNTINTQGVERNLSIMQSWKFDSTPLSIYRGKDGLVKIMPGPPKNVDDLIADLPATAQTATIK